jgi:MFS family permease
VAIRPPARALQGLGEAAAVPAALALIASLYPAAPGRARAMSLLAAMATIGTMSCLIIGGIITDFLGWRWVFFLLAIPAVVAVLVAPHVLDEARRQQTEARHRISFTLTALSLLWLARAPIPARSLTDVGPPLVVRGASLTVVFIVMTSRPPGDAR